MIVHYYEGSALAHPGNPPGKEVTLDDRHKTAWRLFAGETDYAGGQRNFVFRAEPLGPNRDLYMLRSAEPFPGGRPREMAFEAGDQLLLEWLMMPTRTLRVPGQRGRHVAADRKDWPMLASDRLAGAGFALVESGAVQTLDWTGVRDVRRRKGRCTVAKFRAAVRVIDPTKAASAWLDGVGRKKGYGLGMLCRVEG